LDLRIPVSFIIATLARSIITSGGITPTVAVAAPTVAARGEGLGLAVVAWMAAMLVV
jgi:hypothetical protein